MKNIVTMLVLLSMMFAVPAFAKVYTRLQMVSNDKGVMVVNVQAMSDDGAPLISLYRGAFKISETLEKRVVAVEFEHLLFERPDYIQEYGYSTPYRKVTWIYTYNKPLGKPYAAIGTQWVSVMRVTITYNQSDELGTLSWAGSPYYLVKDDQGNDISGDYYPIPPELQDFPLPVQMSLFTANTQDDGKVKVSWRTESELNNLGFNLFRSNNEADGFVRVNEELIAGQGTTSTPRDYVYLDAQADVNQSCWYIIENISIDGLSTFDGPVEATVRSSVKNEIAGPTSYALLQNYPNPFNPSTEIRYNLSKAASVEMTVYNLLGKVTKQLVSGTQAEGMHSVVWNGMNAQGIQVESGIYICELKVADQVFYHKMTLVK
jgi:hypothetical protein